MFVQESKPPSMLSLLTLEVIDNIFMHKPEVKLGIQARALYINCLTHYFKEKPATYANAMAFDLPASHFQKYQVAINQLNQAGLTVVTAQPSIMFNAVWMPYIESFFTMKPRESHKLAVFVDELRQSQKLKELICMQLHIDPADTDKMIEYFIADHIEFEKTYTDFNDCKHHCKNWIKDHFKKLMPQIKTNAPKVVKSSGKLLGDK